MRSTRLFSSPLPCFTLSPVPPPPPPCSYLEAFFCVLISVMVGTFGFMYVDTGVPMWEVLEGFTWPRLPSKDLPTVRLS